MVRVIVRRCLLGLVTLFGVTLAVFVLVNLAGDPIQLMLSGTEATQEDVARLRSELGYDRPLPVQFARFVQRALQGDLGESLRFRQPAAGLVLERLPATIQLAVAAMAVAVGAGVFLGVLAAVHRGSMVDRLSMFLALVGQSVPLFWLGIMAMLVLSVNLRWLPVAGSGTPWHLILPALTLATYPMARIARLVRSSTLEVLGLDYIRTARAKGLHDRIVIYKHALRNALLPVVTLIALQFGALLGGAVVTETIFSWPGVGLLAFQAVTARDLPLVQAVVLVTGATFILMNTTVDVLYAFLDPRIVWD